MKCPYCGSEKSSVVDSRKKSGKNRPVILNNGIDVIWRKRLCSECGAYYNTIEIPYKDPKQLKHLVWMLQIDSK